MNSDAYFLCYSDLCYISKDAFQEEMVTVFTTLVSRNEVILPRFKTHSYDHSLFSEKALFLLAFHKKEKSWNQISSILVELMKLSVECVMQQLIESCLPDGFGCDKCGESTKIFFINGWILLLPLLRSLFSTIAPTLMCTRKSEPHFSRSKAELVLLEISLVRTGIINFVADFNTYTLNVGCSQVICGRISF